MVNLREYDLILGTPFLFQHRVALSFNGTSVFIGSEKSLPIEGDNVSKLAARSIDTLQRDLDLIRQQLLNEATNLGLFTAPELQPLPPLRAINHSIPLIDESLIYPWRPARCPEVFRQQWNAKRDTYVSTGRWKYTTSRNTVPLMCIPKPNKPKDRPELRVAIDLRALNANTHKMTAPLPSIEEILMRAAKRKYCSLADMNAAYEQMWVLPEHVNHTMMAMPDGNMDSKVMQIGDCNVPASWQALMNHIFSPYIGIFMDMYLDDIVIYSDTIEDHIKHIQIIFDVLHHEKLYLSEKKLHLFADELRILGHIVDHHGIRMDPSKVDKVVNWKVPTN